jgi:hypothetical protein
MTFGRYLSPGEQVVFATRRHVWILANEMLMLLASLILVLIWPTTLTGLIALIIGCRFVFEALRWFVDRLVMTNQRIINISGLLNRRVASLPLTMMTDFTYQRPFLGRILGYGTLRVESAGKEGLSRIDYIANDIGFYRTMTTILHPVEGVVSLEEDGYADEAMALVQRGRPVTTWDPDDTNPNMIVLP